MGRKHGTWTSQESVSLTTFADATDAYKPLSFAEEQALGHRIQAGDMDAAEQLVLHNMKFCLSYARKFTGRGVPMDDLVASAYTGMIKASRRFKPGHGKFISYAIHEMRSEIQLCLARQCRVVSFSYRSAAFHGKVLKYLEKNSNIGACTDDDMQKIADAIGVKLHIVRSVLGMMKNSISLSYSADDLADMGRNGGVSVHSKGSTPVDSLIDVGQASPDDCATSLDRRRVVGLIMRTMTSKQRSIVTEMYINGRPPCDIADELGITTQAVFAFRKRAFSHARREYGRLMAQGVL